MSKWIDSSWKKYKWQIHEEMFIILSHKGTNQWNSILPQSEWLSSRKQTIANAGEDVRGKEPLYTAGVNVVSAVTVNISMEVHQKKEKQNYCMILLYHSFEYIQRNVSQHIVGIPVHPCLSDHYLQ
jgi:hypothetical protein